MKERIKLLRKHLGLTQQKFADRLGLKRQTIAAYEIGTIEPSDSTLLLICKEFNVNESWLRDDIGEMLSIPEDETAAIVSDLLEDADDEFYKMVLDVVRTYQQLQPDSRKVLENFCRQLAENIKTRKD